MVMNKPFVALLCALTAMATVNMVIATGPMIQKVFVTNWPTNVNATVTNRNLNVTVTNPPTTNLNITANASKPALDLAFVKGQVALSCALPTNSYQGSYNYNLNTLCPVSFETSVRVSGYKNVRLFVSFPFYDIISYTRNITGTGYNYTISYHYALVQLGYGPLAGADKAFESSIAKLATSYQFKFFNFTYPYNQTANKTGQAQGAYVFQYEVQPIASILYVRFYVLHIIQTGSYDWVTGHSYYQYDFPADTSTTVTASVYASD